MNPTVVDAIQLQQWLAATARKDQQAFQALYAATSAKLFGFALRIVNKRELAEEVLQDAYVNIWNHAGNYQASLAAPLTWMISILRNRAIDQLRRLHHDVEIDGDDFAMQFIEAIEQPGGTPLQQLEMSQDANALAACMARLERAHRQAMALAYFHDLSHSEVATQLSMPIGTVKTWLRRGIDKLRLCLRPELAQ